MSSFKQLNKSDVTVVPYYANKQWDLNFCLYPTSFDYLVIYKGTNVTGSFSLDGDPITEGQYERLVYDQINHLFYQNYTESLDTSSLMFTLNNYESASQQRPTASYFIYNDNSNLIQNFPTGAMEGIRVISINQNIYGNKILPNNFQLSSSNYNIKDDGYGNLFDYSGSKTHVGNIYYAHGLSIITNQDYQSIFPLPPIAVSDVVSFLTTDTKTISASLNDYARDGVLVPDSLTLYGVTSSFGYSWATGSGNTIVLTTTIPGTYSIYYTIQAIITESCGIVYLESNKAKITANITEPTTTTTTTTTSTTTTTTTVCPCVTSLTIQNTDVVTINYSYRNCSDVLTSGTLASGATFTLPAGDPPVGQVKNGSVIITGGSATVTYGSCA